MWQRLAVEVVLRSGLWKWVAAALVGAILATTVAVGALVAVALQAVSSLTFQPTAVTALSAYAAASRCDFTPHPKLSTAYLVAMAWVQNSDGGLGFGTYRNPLGGVGDAGVPDDILARVDRTQLREGGFTHRMLGLSADLSPADWTTVLPDLHGEHGVGFLLVSPSEWRQWVREVPGQSGEGLDPYKPYDAFLAAACHLQRLTAAAGGAAEAVQHALQSV